MIYRLLVLCSLICCPALLAQTLVINANGYTFKGQTELVQFQSMLIEQGKVVALGGSDLLKQYPKAELVDVQGKTLLPGLIDAHGHVIGLGLSLLQVDVRNITSKKGTVNHVAEFAAKHPELTWVQGRGWNQVLWPDKQFPTAQDLDEMINSKPVWLSRVDGHAGWANSAALKMAGINRDTLDPPGGQILRDETGNPSGILIDNAMDLMWKVLPKEDNSVLELAFNAAQQRLLSLGITSVHDAGISNIDYQLYESKAATHQLKMRFYPMLGAWDAHFQQMLKKGVLKSDDDKLLIRSIKISADGALGSRGAAMIKPYSDEPQNMGLMTTSEQDMEQLYSQAMQHGFQVNVHAIGDRGNRVALDVFQKIQPKFAGTEFRNRIEHAQIVDPADIPRFKTLNLIASMQPTHATSDKNMAGDRVGDERLKGAYAWQTLLAQGTIIAAGSDFPVEYANPMFGLHAAVTRQSQDDQPQGGWRNQESLSIQQAFKAFTIDAAYAAHQESVIGSLEAGKWADFIVIDQDIFAIDPKQLWKVQVLQTWVAGERQFVAD